MVIGDWSLSKPPLAGFKFITIGSTQLYCAVYTGANMDNNKITITFLLITTSEFPFNDYTMLGKFFYRWHFEIFSYFS